MGKKYNYEFIIIGGGPAGATLARGLKRAKKSVAIVESDKIGGASINTRDLPFAASLKFSHLYREANLGTRYGISQGMGMHFNLPTALNWQERAIEKARDNELYELNKLEIPVLEGSANFLSNHEISVGEKRFTAEKFIIATGARTKIREIAGVDNVSYYTPEGAIKMRRLPQAVAIIGAGATGCELAQFYAELGAKVILFERSERILPREDSEAGNLMANIFAKKLGIVVLTGAKVVAIEQDDLSKRVVFSDGANEKLVRVSDIVFATGSEPEINLGLENAGVKYRKSGIIVDKTLQTSERNIYAIGDAISVDNSSTEKAVYQATVLLQNLLHRGAVEASYVGFSRVVKTAPCVASTGLNEEDLIRRDRKYDKAIVLLNEVQASIGEDFYDGFVKILTDKRGIVIGATIMAPAADLMIQELALAVRQRMSVIDIASAPHIANSFGQAVKLAARKLANK